MPIPLANLKTKLLMKGVSQQELSHALKVNPAKISQIVRGWKEPPEELRKAIADYLEESEEVLFR
jgi:transcriptional regulator with XRE-family HTH domain